MLVSWAAPCCMPRRARMPLRGQGSGSGARSIAPVTYALRTTHYASIQPFVPLCLRGIRTENLKLKELYALHHQGVARAYLFSTDAGAFWARTGFREVPVPELVAALPAAPQVRHYDALGWLPTEVAWRRDLVD